MSNGGMLWHNGIPHMEILKNTLLPKMNCGPYQTIFFLKLVKKQVLINSVL